MTSSSQLSLTAMNEIPASVWLGILFIALVALVVFLRLRNEREKTSATPAPSPTRPVTTPPESKLSLGRSWLLWLEKALLKLNREMHGEERAPEDSRFLQRLPESFLDKDVLSPKDVEEFATYLVSETRKRIGSLDIPFRKPRVEFTNLLPNNEPGHIEFRWDETIIRIHPKYRDDTFGLAAVLCHELAHFVLDHNGLRKNNTAENERLTDLFVLSVVKG